MFNESQPINSTDIKRIDVTVDDLYIFRVAGENRLFIISEDTKYVFDGRPTLREYSPSQLYDFISKGDILSLGYYEENRILFGKINVIVDARSGTEIYRSIEEYNRGKTGVVPFLIIIFCLVELIFGGYAFLYVILNRNTLKSLMNRIFRRRYRR